jgi:hypothetical protein
MEEENAKKAELVQQTAAEEAKKAKAEETQKSFQEMRAKKLKLAKSSPKPALVKENKLVVPQKAVVVKKPNELPLADDFSDGYTLMVRAAGARARHGAHGGAPPVRCGSSRLPCQSPRRPSCTTATPTSSATPPCGSWARAPSSRSSRARWPTGTPVRPRGARTRRLLADRRVRPAVCAGVEVPRPLEIDTWTHVAVVHSKTDKSLRVLVDGREAASSTVGEPVLNNGKLFLSDPWNPSAKAAVTDIRWCACASHGCCGVRHTAVQAELHRRGQVHREGLQRAQAG